MCIACTGMGGMYLYLLWSELGAAPWAGLGTRSTLAPETSGAWLVGERSLGSLGANKGPIAPTDYAWVAQSESIVVGSMVWRLHEG